MVCLCVGTQALNSLSSFQCRAHATLQKVRAGQLPESKTVTRRSDDGPQKKQIYRAVLVRKTKAALELKKSDQ
jgi:hypothetical protein